MEKQSNNANVADMDQNDELVHYIEANNDDFDAQVDVFDYCITFPQFEQNAALFFLQLHSIFQIPSRTAQTIAEELSNLNQMNIDCLLKTYLE